jgi:hypothetical protein
MGLEAVHPYYAAFQEDWIAQRDLHAGERVVKSKREVYLPPTPSMILDGFGSNKKNCVGDKVYDSYIKRAVFPDYVSEAVAVLVGMLHHKPADIELPEVMKPMLEKATLEGESLHDLLRRINYEQMITGRIGLLADLPVAQTGEDGKPVVNMAPGLPFIATYVAEAITNWDESDNEDGFVTLNLVVLNESGLKRDADFVWKTVKKYRVLTLGDTTANEAVGEYRIGTFSDDQGSNQLAFSEDLMVAPMYRGKKLDQIPFVFINTRDLLSRPDESPTLGLGRLVLAIYRGEADYRQGLFMTGQDTLVVIGGVRNADGVPGEDDAVRTGAGSRIDVDINGDAKYIGVESSGLSEQRSALENDRKHATLKSGQLIEGKSKQESGEALSTRLTAQTASLNQIAITAAKGLETMLKKIAEWIGANPEEVKVKPNMEFGDPNLKVSDLNELMDARTKGFPISKKSLHQLAVERRLTKMEYEDEMELIQEEDAAMPRTGQGATNLTADEQLAEQEANRTAAAEAAEAKKKQAGGPPNA